jgi:hypothetical protein
MFVSRRGRNRESSGAALAVVVVLPGAPPALAPQLAVVRLLE